MKEAQKDGPLLSYNTILESIKDKIGGNEILREVYEREGESFQDLIDKHGEERVRTAIDIVEAYRLLLKVFELSKEDKGARR